MPWCPRWVLLSPGKAHPNINNDTIRSGVHMAVPINSCLCKIKLSDIGLISASACHEDY